MDRKIAKPRMEFNTPLFCRGDSARGAGRSDTRRMQRRVEVPDDVVRVLQADGDPDHAVRDADPEPLLRRDCGMRHRSRMGDYRFHPSQALGESAEPDVLEE